MITTLTEQWRPVHANRFADAYQVSDLGRVRSLDRLRSGRFGPQHCDGKVLRPRTHPLGYQQVNLCIGSGYKTFLVHRLVAHAFVPNPDSLPMVNHIDGVKANNIATNLQWIDDRGNRQHAIDIGRITMFKKLLTADEVTEIRRLGGTMRQVDIAARFGTTQTNVSLILLGRTHDGMAD